MAPLKEEHVLAALRKLAESAERRRNAQQVLAEIDREHRENMLAALEAGATTRRVREVGELSPDTINRWKKAAQQEQPANAKGTT